MCGGAIFNQVRGSVPLLPSYRAPVPLYSKITEESTPEVTSHSINTSEYKTLFGASLSEKWNAITRDLSNEDFDVRRDESS